MVFPLCSSPVKHPWVFSLRLLGPKSTFSGECNRPCFSKDSMLLGIAVTHTPVSSGEMDFSSFSCSISFLSSFSTCHRGRKTPPFLYSHFVLLWCDKHYWLISKMWAGQSSHVHITCFMSILSFLLHPILSPPFCAVFIYIFDLCCSLPHLGVVAVSFLLHCASPMS